MSSRVESLVEALLARVVDGTYRPGSPLPAEDVLARELAVSRLTVREAAKVLVARGILTSRQGSGTYVVDPAKWRDVPGLVALERSRRDERELGLALLEVRRMLEVGSAGLAAARRTEDHLDLLERSIAGLRGAHEIGDVEAAVRADLDFHDTILAAAGNPFILATYAPLRAELVRARRVTSAHAEVRQHALVHHERILLALRLGSPDAAKATMRAHMEQTSNDLLAHVPVPGPDRGASQTAPAGPPSDRKA